jgi:glutamyl/glutaminyl-tRNA synthetase
VPSDFIRDLVAADVASNRFGRWLGFAWDAELYASDEFEQLYEIAERLVKAGKAYVDSPSEAGIREGRGTVTRRSSRAWPRTRRARATSSSARATS